MAHKSIRLMAPSDMSADGWDIINARSDIEAIPFNDDEPSTALHSALQDVDGIILVHVRFSAVEIAIASKLRAVGRLGVGVDSVDVPALTGMATRPGWFLLARSSSGRSRASMARCYLRFT
jgi:D-3-phosphoglycerate dehydrogenase / 2-oxoglutarate reductase